MDADSEQLEWKVSVHRRRRPARINRLSVYGGKSVLRLCKRLDRLRSLRCASPSSDWTVGHPERIGDFGYRAKHQQTLVAKALIVSLYGKAPTRSYFSGCSNAGRQGLMELQRYPEDYDGYIIGAPANNWTRNMAAFTWEYQAWTVDPAAKIPSSKLPAIQAAAQAQCAALDGVQDGIISDPRQCHFNPDVLICPAGTNTDSCLTAPQLTALKKIYAGPTNARGTVLFPAVLPGFQAGIPGNNFDLFVTGSTPGGVLFSRPTLQMLYNRADVDVLGFNFDSDVNLQDSQPGPILNATDTNLEAQKARGIKIIHYHGREDPALPPNESIDYYDGVVASVVASGAPGTSTSCIWCLECFIAFRRAVRLRSTSSKVLHRFGRTRHRRRTSSRRWINGWRREWRRNKSSRRSMSTTIPHKPWFPNEHFVHIRSFRLTRAVAIRIHPPVLRADDDRRAAGG